MCPQQLWDSDAGPFSAPGCRSGVNTGFLFCPPSFYYPCVHPPQPPCSRPCPEDCMWGPPVTEPMVQGSGGPWHPSSPPDDVLDTQPSRHRADPGSAPSPPSPPGGRPSSPRSSAAQSVYCRCTRRRQYSVRQDETLLRFLLH